MGLFGGNKKLCPICGKPASWFLPIKVEGQPLCNDCSGKLSELSSDVSNRVLESETTLREYFAVFDENKALRSSFQQTYRHEFGIIGGCICLDVPNRLLRLSGSDNAFVFEPENIVNFRITEDEEPLFDGTKDELVCYQSAVPEKVKNMKLDVEAVRMDLQRYEQMKRIEEEMERQSKIRGMDYTPQYISSPDVGHLNPFKKFHVYIELDHPYRKEKKHFKEDAPRFSESDPTINGYLHAYNTSVQDLLELATNLMAVINPNAPQRKVNKHKTSGANNQAASGVRIMPIIPTATVDPVAEIQRYKTLLDNGVITEEEFTAKKRQLMGI